MMRRPRETASDARAFRDLINRLAQCFEVSARPPPDWLGKAIMAAVMRLPGRQLRHLGHRRHFPRLRPLDGRQDRLDRDHHRAVPPDLQRPAAAARPPGRPADHARPGARARPRPAGARPAGRRSRARRAARSKLRLDISDAEIAKRDHATTQLPGPERPVRPRPLRADHPPEPATPSRASSPSSARSDTAPAARAAPSRRRSRRRRPRARPLNRYQNEKRSIDYVTLDRAKAGEIAPPTPEAARRTISRSARATFRAPEYRKIVVLSLTPAELARPDEVTDADAKALSTSSARRRYGTPERRERPADRVSRTTEDAKAAAEQIAEAARASTHIAKERGLRPKRHRSRHCRQAAIIDPAVADAAFALKAGEVSEPVKGRFGTVLVRVSKIEPGAGHAVRGGRRRDQAGRSRPSARADATRRRCTTRSRTSAPPARRSTEAAQKAEARRYARSTRSTAPAATPDGKPVGACPSATSCSPAPSRPMSASTTSRCSAERRLRLVRGHRHHAGARRTLDEVKDPGRSTLARRRDRQAPRRPRPTRSSTSSRAARRSRSDRRLNG